MKALSQQKRSELPRAFDPSAQLGAGWALVPPFDASGAFETCRVRGGKILHLKEHLGRLKASLHTLGVSPTPEEELRPTLKKVAQEVRDGFLRVALRRFGEPRVLIYQHPGLPYPKKLIRRGIDLVTVATRRSMVEAVPALVKHSERLNGILARSEGQGALEVLLLGSHGYLTEGTVSNFFLVKAAQLTTPPSWCGVLGGVTRSSILHLASREQIPFEEVPVTRHDLFNADEAFLTNVLFGVLPIRTVDGRRIGDHVPGPITQRLMQAISKED